MDVSGALNTQNKEVMCVTLKIIQQMVMASDLVGPGNSQNFTFPNKTFPPAV